MGWIADLFKEIPLSVNLQSKIEELESKYAILESENIELKSKLNEKDKKIDRLNEIIDSFHKDQAIQKLGQIENQILQYLFDNDRYFRAENIARIIGCDVNTTKYHLNNLLSENMLYKSTRINSPPEYKINDNGIKYIVESKTLNLAASADGLKNAAPEQPVKPPIMEEKMETCNWLSHEFTIYPKKAQWNNEPGIYIFAGLNPDRTLWMPYYIGQCDNFSNRIPSHELWDKAQLLGATHVHALVVFQQDERDSIEKELIQFFQPSLNVQLR